MSYVDGSHPVAKEQFEPGVTAGPQPRQHHVQALIQGVNLSAVYGVHRRLGIEIQMPFRANVIWADFDDAQGDPIDDFESIHHRNEVVAGIGDAALGLRWAVLRPMDVDGLTVDLSVAVSLPTGHVEADPFKLGKNGQKHQHMFFGSGTFMPRIGLAAGYAFDGWSLIGWANTTLALYENDKGYKPSTSVIGGIGAVTRFGLESVRFALQSEVFHEIPAKWGGQLAENSGRTDLLAGLAVFFDPSPAWSVYAMAKTPYLSWAKDDQFSVPFVVTIGVSFTADLLDG